jgi:hypothetical protein
MRPAQGQANLAAFGQHLVAAVAIDLADAAEAGEMSDRPFRLAVGSIDIDDAGWIGAAPRPVIAGISPELPVFVRPRPGSSTGVVVSSANSLGELFSSASIRSCTGRNRKAARPTQSASVERSSATPWRA